MPETISTRSIYSGRIFEVRIDTIREAGSEFDREIVSHKGSAVIIPVFDDRSIAMVRQYRYAASEFLLELPAGTLDAGESAEIGARRELEEEIGVTAGKIEKIAEFYVSPGFLTEKMSVYLATELTETAQNLDIGEILEVERFTFSKAFEMIRDGRIKDAKTIIGLTFAGPRFGSTFN